MLSRFNLILCIVMVSLFGCFESFEEALERTGKVYTCDHNADECLPGYSCVQTAVEPNQWTCLPSELDICQPTEWYNDGVCEETPCQTSDPACDENNGGESGAAGTGSEAGAAGAGSEAGAAGAGSEAGAAGTGGEAGAAGTGGSAGAAGMGGESGAAGTGGEAGAAGTGGESGSGGTTQNGFNACIARCENMIYLAEACGGQGCPVSRDCAFACGRDSTRYNELEQLETMVNRVRANVDANQVGACSSISTEAEGMIAAIEGICTGFNLCDSDTYDGQTSPVVKWALESSFTAFEKSSNVAGTQRDFEQIEDYSPTQATSVAVGAVLKIVWRVEAPTMLPLSGNIEFELVNSNRPSGPISFGYLLRIVEVDSTTASAPVNGRMNIQSANSHTLTFGLENSQIGFVFEASKSYDVTLRVTNNSSQSPLNIKPSFSALKPFISGSPCTSNCYPQAYPTLMCELILDESFQNGCVDQSVGTECFPIDYSQEQSPEQHCVNAVGASDSEVLINACESRFKSIAHYRTGTGVANSSTTCIAPISCR